MNTFNAKNKNMILVLISYLVLQYSPSAHSAGQVSIEEIRARRPFIMQQVWQEAHKMNLCWAVSEFQESLATLSHYKGNSTIPSERVTMNSLAVLMRLSAEVAVIASHENEAGNSVYANHLKDELSKCPDTAAAISFFDLITSSGFSKLTGINPKTFGSRLDFSRQAIWQKEQLVAISTIHESTDLTSYKIMALALIGAATDLGVMIATPQMEYGILAGVVAIGTGAVAVAVNKGLALTDYMTKNNLTHDKVNVINKRLKHPMGKYDMSSIMQSYRTYDIDQGGSQTTFEEATLSCANILLNEN